MASSWDVFSAKRQEPARPARWALPAVLAMILAVLVAPEAALAQAPAPADDLARCEQLYARYERYSNAGGESRQGSAFSAAEARAALQDCRRGNTAQGLAVLQRKLRALGFKD